MKMPKQIIVIRHAEKPAKKDDKNLSEEGKRRAEMLADYIPDIFDIPDFIFATAPSKESKRPIQTVQPLARRFGLKIKKKYADDEYNLLAEKILGKRKYKGKDILICWHHGKIPGLIAALGAKLPKELDPWPVGAFGHVLFITYEANKKCRLEIYEMPSPDSFFDGFDEI